MLRNVFEVGSVYSIFYFSAVEVSFIFRPQFLSSHATIEQFSQARDSLYDGHTM